MRLDIFLIVFAILLVPSLAFSQGALLQKGEDGYGMLAGPVFVTDAVFIQGAFVLTASGRFDLGFSILHEVKSDNYGQNNVFGVGTEFYVFREDDIKKIPFTSSVYLQFSDISSTYFGTAGISVYKRFEESRRSFVQPFFTFSYTKRFGGYGELRFFGGGCGISITSNVGQSAVFSFTPAVMTDYYGVTGAISIGITISLTPRSEEEKPVFDF